MRTRIKICGITNLDDAMLAIDAGADAIGMIFYPPSPRNIDFETARVISHSLSPFISCIAVVVDPNVKWLRKLLSQLNIHQIQFHGDETDQFCQSFAKPYYKALKVKQESKLINEMKAYEKANAFLLDTYTPDKKGGSGETFDWSIIPKTTKPIIVAGGLTPDNAYQVITQVKPYAIDVNSGIEIKPGIKDKNKLKELIIAAQQADKHCYNR